MKRIGDVHVLWADPPEPVKDAPLTIKWCFGCRKRLAHSLWVVSGEYFDPEFYWKCERCKQARTEFPQ